MATHFSALAWRIPGTGEPGGLLSMGSHRVGHDWSDLAAAAAAAVAESEEELKSLLMKVKDEHEKAGFKLNMQKTKIMNLVPSLHGKYMGEKWKYWQILFSWAPKSLWMMTAAMKLKDACSLEEKLWQT